MQRYEKSTLMWVDFSFKYYFLRGMMLKQNVFSP